MNYGSLLLVSHSSLLLTTYSSLLPTNLNDTQSSCLRLFDLQPHKCAISPFATYFLLTAALQICVMSFSQRSMKFLLKDALQICVMSFSRRTGSSLSLSFCLALSLNFTISRNFFQILTISSEPRSFPASSVIFHALMLIKWLGVAKFHATKIFSQSKMACSRKFSTFHFFSTSSSIFLLYSKLLRYWAT
jgi:hypothetical protein